MDVALNEHTKGVIVNPNTSALVVSDLALQQM